MCRQRIVVRFGYVYTQFLDGPAYPVSNGELVRAAFVNCIIHATAHDRHLPLIAIPYFRSESLNFLSKVVSIYC